MCDTFAHTVLLWQRKVIRHVGLSNCPPNANRTVPGSHSPSICVTSHYVLCGSRFPSFSRHTVCWNAPFSAHLFATRGWATFFHHTRTHTHRKVMALQCFYGNVQQLLMLVMNSHSHSKANQTSAAPMRTRLRKRTSPIVGIINYF